MRLKEAFATGTPSETDGIWFREEIPGDMEFKVARWMNPHHAEAQRQLRTDGETDDMVVGRRAMASTILMDWRNVQDDAGLELEYSPEVGEECFAESPEMMQAVMICSMTADKYVAEKQEATSGN